MGIRLFLLLVLVCWLPKPQALLHYQGIHRQSTKPSTINANSNSYACNLQMRLNPTSFEGTKFVITEFPRPALRFIPNTPIESFDDALLSRSKEMMTVMYKSQGVGLAAPQVGLNEMMFVYNPSGDPEVKNMERIVCNPQVTEYSTETDVEEEGCLSLRSDDCAGLVARSSWIQVEYQNELGQKVLRRLKGFEARVFQHEYDHLQGILCWDRFPPEDREAVQANIDRLLTAYPESDARIDADPEQVQAMKPPALSVKRMPPLGTEAEEEPKKKKPAPIKKSGFGASAADGPNTSSKKTKPKKKKGKK